MIRVDITVPSDSCIPHLTVIGPPRDLPFHQVFPLCSQWWLVETPVRSDFWWQLKFDRVKKISSIVLLRKYGSYTLNNLRVRSLVGATNQESCNQPIRTLHSNELDQGNINCGYVNMEPSTICNDGCETRLTTELDSYLLISVPILLPTFCDRWTHE